MNFCNTFKDYENPKLSFAKKNSYYTLILSPMYTNLTRLADRHMSLTLLSLDMVLPVSSQLFSSLGGGGGRGTKNCGVLSN